MNTSRIAAALTLPFVALALVACGSGEPSSQPVSEPTVEASQPATSEPVEATEPAVDCWSADTAEFHEFVADMNSAGSDEAQLVLLRTLPDPSEGCKKSDRETLTTFAAERERITALLAG